jgi:hypothetical protein
MSHSTQDPKALEAQILSEISARELMRNMSAIAKWERLSATSEEWEAADYVRDTLEAYGVPTRVHNAEILVSLPRDAGVKVTSPEALSFEAYTHSFSPSTPAGGLEGELVYVGPGLTDADYAGKEVRGKIALVDGLAAPPVAWLAEQQGTAGQIYVSGEYLHFMIVSTIWGAPTPETADRLPRTPSASIRRDDGERLKQLLEQGPVRVRLDTETWTGWSTAHLVEGEIEGTTEPEKFVLFSGHLDSWAYGAMDNGSANATMLEVARVLAQHRDQLRRSVRFLFWSGHSHGRYAGSAWYADHFWHELHAGCVAHVNVDSTGAQGATAYDAVEAMAEVGSLAVQAVADVTGQRPQRRRMGRHGDQSFWGVGVPSMYGVLSRVPPDQSTQDAGLAALGVTGMPWWWHTVYDTVDKIDPEVLRLDTQIFAAAILRLCSAAVLPFDYAAAVDELQVVLDEVQQEAGDHFDLTSIVEQAAQLRERVQQLNLAVERLADDGAVEAANACLLQLAHLLIPLRYTKVGRFDHDLALGVPPLPTLHAARRLASLDPDSDDYRYLQTKLIRERNKALYVLKQANQAIADCLAALP